MSYKLSALIFLMSFGLLAQTTPSRPTGQTPEETGDSEDTAPPPPPVYKPIQFSVFVWPTDSILLSTSEIGDIPRVFLDGPYGRELVSLVRNSSTPLLRYVGPQPLELYDLDFEEIPVPADAPPGTFPEMREIRSPKIRVDVPEEFTSVMIVVMPGKKNADGTMVAIALPYHTSALGPGKARIYNSSGQDIILQFKDETGPVLNIRENRHLDFDPSRVADSNYVRVMGYTRDAAGEPRRVHVSKMLFKEDTNNFFILYAQGRRVRMLRLGGHEESEPPVSPTPIPPPGGAAARVPR